LYSRSLAERRVGWLIGGLVVLGVVQGSFGYNKTTLSERDPERKAKGVAGEYEYVGDPFEQVSGENKPYPYHPVRPRGCTGVLELLESWSVWDYENVLTIFAVVWDFEYDFTIFVVVCRFFPWNDCNDI
jgi:hypothetical protein